MTFLSLFPSFRHRRSPPLCTTLLSSKYLYPDYFAGYRRTWLQQYCLLRHLDRHLQCSGSPPGATSRVLASPVPSDTVQLVALPPPHRPIPYLLLHLHHLRRRPHPCRLPWYLATHRPVIYLSYRRRRLLVSTPALCRPGPSPRSHTHTHTLQTSLDHPLARGELVSSISVPGQMLGPSLVPARSPPTLGLPADSICPL